MLKRAQWLAKLTQYKEKNLKTYLSGWSWESGEVPVNWKLASVVSVVKKGNKDNLGNYRPVSLTSVPGTVMEKIILGVIGNHLKANAVTGHSQWVHKGKALFNEINFLLWQGYPPNWPREALNAIFLYYNKTFSTVSHSIFLEKTFTFQLVKYVIG